MSPLLLFMVGKFLTKAPPLAAVTTATATRPEVARRAVAAPAPWPAPVPDDLPAFPAGWEYDQPLRPEVVARATQLIPSLWARGRGARVVEYVGGRWLTFVAADHGGKRAVEAYRVRKAPPKASNPKPKAPKVVPRRVDPKAIATSATQLADEIRRTSVRAAPAPAAPAPAAPARAAKGPAAKAPTGPRNAAPRVRPDPSRDVFVAPPTIRQGARGPDVSRAQSALNRRGASLKVDAIFGPLTTAATKTFQRSEGLVPDGIIGPKTWEVLLT